MGSSIVLYSIGSSIVLYSIGSSIVLYSIGNCSNWTSASLGFVSGPIRKNIKKLALQKLPAIQYRACGMNNVIASSLQTRQLYKY